jgi:hypothetical protein
MQAVEKDLDLKIATENIQNLSADDVILASYLGSGSSLIGGILIELGLDYIEGYQEKISKDKQQTEVVLPLWRKHWKQLDTKYDVAKPKELRLFKTHFYPVSFAKAKPKKAVLLIRDARDAVISYYNWRKGFSDEYGTLSDFLTTNGYYGKKPFDDWTSYIEEWCKWGSQKGHELYLIKYEDLKFSPEETVKNLLRFLKIKRGAAEIKRAVENSRFSKIKKEEMQVLQNSDQPRIFRRGLVGEWRNTLSLQNLNCIKAKTTDMLRKYCYIEANNGKFKQFTHWFIGYNSATRKHIQKLLQQGEKVVLIPLKPRYYHVENPNFLVLKGPFLPNFLDIIGGNIYLSVPNEEIVRSVENVAQTKGFALFYI